MFFRSSSCRPGKKCFVSCSSGSISCYIENDSILTFSWLNISGSCPRN